MTTCCVCGERFEPRNPRKPPKTCSRACTNKMVWAENPVRKTGPDAQPRVMRDCEHCGKPIGWRATPGRQAAARFCSKRCTGLAKGKGGMSYDADGRLRVHLRSGSKQLYSRCLMEGHLRRHLEFNEVVHHINGDPFDDRLENLRVMPRSEHTRMHTVEYWSILRAQSRVGA